jgi:hypothetical protein
MAKIILDKERELCLDLNAIDKFYEKTGINLLKGEGLKEAFSDPKPQIIKAFVWACLIRESPELTLEDVGKLITLKNMGAVTEAIISLAQEVENPLSDIGPSASSTQT